MGAKIYFSAMTSPHTGAHKVNNVLAKLLASAWAAAYHRRDGAGMHGVATHDWPSSAWNAGVQGRFVCAPAPNVLACRRWGPRWGRSNRANTLKSDDERLRYWVTTSPTRSTASARWRPASYR